VGCSFFTFYIPLLIKQIMQTENTSTSMSSPGNCIYTLNNKKLKTKNINLTSANNEIKLNINNTLISVTGTDEVIKNINISDTGIHIQY
jgi:hypothetical protein